MTYQAIFVLITGLALTAGTRHAQRVMLGLLVFLMVLFVGSRREVGCDFWGYSERFELYDLFVSLGQGGELLQRSEPGFALVNLAVIHLGLPYFWINVACAIIFFACFYVFAGRRERPVAMLALAFPILIVQLAMSGLRQATATALLMLAFHAFSRRQRVMMAFWIILASTFHASALMFMPLVFLIGRNINLATLAVGTLVALPAVALFAGDRVDVYQDRYGEGDVVSFGAVFRTGLIVITAVMFELYSDSFRRLYPQDYPLMRLFSIFAFGLAIVTVVSSIAAHRIGFYLMPVHILTLVRLPLAMSHGRRPDPLIAAMPFIAYGAYIVVWFATSKHARLCYTPYDSYLLGNPLSGGAL